MANEISTTDRAPGAEAIFRLAQRPQAWTKTEVLRLAGAEPIAALREAEQRVVATFAPVEPASRADWRLALASRLDPIAAKIAPTMSDAQGEAWRSAMLDALSNLPAMVALTAAKRALHQPMQFISEVEGTIRVSAAAIIADRQDAIRRIQWLIADLEAAARPKLPPAEPGAPPDPAELVEAMAKVTDPTLKGILRRAAVEAGWQPEEAALS